MAGKRSPKGQLGPLDYEVLRACRWTWWNNAMGYIKTQNRSVTHVRVYPDSVLDTLVRAKSPNWDKWNGRDKVAYRMRKLAKQGYMKNFGHSGFIPTAQMDPHIGKLEQEFAAAEQRREQLIKQRMERVSAMIDRIVPGHTLSIQQGYLYGGESSEDVRIMVSGFSAQLLMILRLAEITVIRQDEEAAAMQDEVY